MTAWSQDRGRGEYFSHSLLAMCLYSILAEQVWIEKTLTKPIFKLILLQNDGKPGTANPATGNQELRWISGA